MWSIYKRSRGFLSRKQQRRYHSCHSIIQMNSKGSSNIFTFKPLSATHKMVKHTQTIRRLLLLPTNCFSVFDHFVGLVLKVKIKPQRCVKHVRIRVFSDPHIPSIKAKSTILYIYGKIRVRENPVFWHILFSATFKGLFHLTNTCWKLKLKTAKPMYVVLESFLCALSISYIIFLYKQVGPGLSPQSCLYFQGFWASKVLKPLVSNVH